MIPPTAEKRKMKKIIMMKKSSLHQLVTRDLSFKAEIFGSPVQIIYCVTAGDRSPFSAGDRSSAYLHEIMVERSRADRNRRNSVEVDILLPVYHVVSTC